MCIVYTKPGKTRQKDSERNWGDELYCTRMGEGFADTARETGFWDYITHKAQLDTDRNRGRKDRENRERKAKIMGNGIREGIRQTR